GQAFSGLVATVSDDRAGDWANPGDLIVTVDWGDGTPLAHSGDGTVWVMANMDGTLEVHGEHVYADDGTYQVQVGVVDLDDYSSSGGGMFGSGGGMYGPGGGGGPGGDTLTAGNLTPPVAVEGQAVSSVVL